jgi:hypothetical protein
MSIYREPQFIEPFFADVLAISITNVINSIFTFLRGAPG